MTNMHTVLLFGCHCVINETSVTTHTRSRRNTVQHGTSLTSAGDVRQGGQRGTRGPIDRSDACSARRQKGAITRKSGRCQSFPLGSPLKAADDVVRDLLQRARAMTPTPYSISAQCTAHLASTGETLPCSQIVRRHCCSHRVPSPLLFGISNTNHASPL